MKPLSQFDAEIDRDTNSKLKLGAKDNRERVGKKFVLKPLRKGLLEVALDAWLARNGHGLSAITRDSTVWSKRRVA